MDINSLYTFLNNIFGRQQNENYTNRNRSNFAGGLADLRNGWAAMQNDRLNRKRQQAYLNDTGDNTNTNTGIGANANGVYGIGNDSVGNTGIGANANGVYGIGQQPINDNSISVGSYANGGSPLENLVTTSGIDLLSGKGGDFSSIFSGKGFNGGSLANPSTPSVSLSNSLAQGIGGQNNVSARDLSRYLGNEYNRANWMAADARRGVTDPAISLLRYEAKVAPLVQAAREDDMRNAFMTYNSESATPEQKMNALAKLAYYTKTPDLADRIQRGHDNDMYRQGYVRDNSDVGNNILSAFKDYEEGAQWMSPDGTGDSRTQCSNFVSDVLRKVGLDIGSPNGDELMKQFGKAYHTGLDGIQAGDVLNFKDHVGFYVGNGQYIARNSSGGVHQGSMEEAIKNFGQPLGYASVREYATGVPRYRRDTSKESLLGLKHKYRMAEIEARDGQRNGRNPRQKAISPEDAEQAIYDYADSEAPTFKQGHAIGQAWAQDFADYAKEYEDVGQAARQMYYDYAAMSPEERGWSMSSEKLALGVGYAYAHAKGLQGMQASKAAKKIMDYLLGQKPSNNTNTGASGGTSPKKGKKLSETATSSNSRGLDEREQTGALRELDEVRDYNDTQPIVTSLGDVASFVKNGGQIGDGKIGDQLVGMVENAGTSKVTPKRRNR